MLLNYIPASFFATSNPSPYKPSKPRLSFEKTKAKLAEYFAENQRLRDGDVGFAKLFPRMHQSVQGTAWQLLMYYMKNWGRGNASNYELRITHSYIRKALNDSCCIATIKHHINKILRMYKSFVVEKTRGGLNLAGQNTACIVLKIDPAVLVFDDPRHNEAIALGTTPIPTARLDHPAVPTTPVRDRNAAPTGISSIFQAMGFAPNTPYS